MKIISLLLIIVIAFSGFNCSEDSVTQPAPVIDTRLVFYSLEQEIHTITQGQDLPEYIVDGGYPIWLESKSLIGFHSRSNFNYYIYNIEQKDTIRTYDIYGYGTFTAGRFSEHMNKFLFAVNRDGHPSIALMDILGNIEIISLDYPISNPVCSGVDDWIYFLNNIDGTRDVSRMKPDGSLIEHITNSQEFLYANFSVSYDGNYIAVPKWNDTYHSIAVIDTKTKQERLIDLTNLNLVGYTSFSKNNEHIFFTGGDTRDLYRINFDGTNLIQITDSTFDFYYRPLYW